MNEISYGEAKKAKEVLVEYLEKEIDYVEVTDARGYHSYSLAYLALKQEFFLD